MSSDTYFVHPSSYVDPCAQIGKGTKVWHFSHVMSGAKIGKNCNIGQNVFIGSGVVIGNRVKIQNNVSIYQGVIIEDDVFCGPSMVFTNVLRPRAEFPKEKNTYVKTVVRKGATIGANATIIAGVTLGRYSFAGAGSVVTNNVPDFGLCYGNPAKLTGWCCVCGHVLEEKAQHATCINCSREYLFSRGVCRPAESI
ncbi:N-acetyltransferase [Candidatus Micrarchaeota archaeon]|nr:MAG: N-acetyltransferase [Candidatus Micrarchaeota archaeon]